jgi:hypothetical protein
VTTPGDIAGASVLAFVFGLISLAFHHFVLGYRWEGGGRSLYGGRRPSRGMSRFMIAFWTLWIVASGLVAVGAGVAALF